MIKTLPHFHPFLKDIMLGGYCNEDCQSCFYREIMEVISKDAALSGLLNIEQIFSAEEIRCVFDDN